GGGEGLGGGGGRMEMGREVGVDKGAELTGLGRHLQVLGIRAAVRADKLGIDPILVEPWPWTDVNHILQVAEGQTAAKDDPAVIVVHGATPAGQPEDVTRLQ